MTHFLKITRSGLVFLLLSIFPAHAAWNLEVTEHRLSNGMKVLAVERPADVAVAFTLFYRVGSVDEQPDMRGMAHYCEHMMFKSTKHLAGEAFKRWISALGGGIYNANTSFDRTFYYEVLSPDRLELAVRLEAERMAYLRPTKEEARKEMQVVREELRLNYLDKPRGRLYRALYRHAFRVHPYRITTIGRMEDLERIQYRDLMRFHHKFYTPANAVAVVAGRFQTDDLLRLMETFFGRIPSGNANKRRYPEEPEQTAERRFRLELPVQESCYMAGYKVPPASHPDNLVLRVLSFILSKGSSSPFAQLCKGDHPVSMYAITSCRPTLEPGLFMITAVPLPGASLETLEKRIDAIIRSIREKGVTKEELHTATARMLTEQVYNMESSLDIARLLGEAEMVHDWRDEVFLEERLQNITLDDIRNAAARYLVPTRRTVGFLSGDPKPVSEVSR